MLPQNHAQQAPPCDAAPRRNLPYAVATSCLVSSHFAEDLEQSLGTPIPPEIKADPEKFEAFVRQHLESALKDTSSPMAAQAARLHACPEDATAAAVSPQ